jgi:hypothetical protein
MNVNETINEFLQERKMQRRRCSYIVMSAPVYTKLNNELNGSRSSKIIRLHGMDVIVLDLDDETLIVG